MIHRQREKERTWKKEGEERNQRETKRKKMEEDEQEGVQEREALFEIEGEKKKNSQERGKERVWK